MIKVVIAMKFGKRELKMSNILQNPSCRPKVKRKKKEGEEKGQRYKYRYGYR